MTTIKVLHYLDTPAGLGGTEVLILDLYRNARCSRLNVLVAGQGVLAKEYIKFDPSRFIECRRSLPIDFRIIFLLRKIIKQRHINVVHAHNVVAAVHVYMASLFTGTKIVFSHYNFANLDNWKDRLARPFLMKRVRANTYICCELMKYYCRKYHLTNINLVIGGRLDFKRLKITRGSDFKKELNIDKNSILLGMVGNFHSKIRDQMTICRALPKIIRTHPQVHFIFVGDPAGGRSYYDECYSYCARKNILSNVRFMGTRRDVPNILKSLIIYVHSSSFDTQSIATIDALAIGLPTVLSNIPAFVEFYSNCGGVTFFKAGNGQNLAKKINSLLGKHQELQALGQVSKHWARQNFDINIYIKELCQLYDSLIL